MSDKSFKDSMIYPILFMLVTCVVFVGVLAVLFRSSEAKIADYKKNSYQKIVLTLLAEPICEAISSKPLQLLNDYPNSFNSYIKETTFPGTDRRIFVAQVDNKVLGYCVDIRGKGLWGTMRALVALTPDFKKLLGLSIYEQMETPGLGARIGEEWFLNQFKNYQIIKANGKPGDFVTNAQLIPEGSLASAPNQIRQITGATITSSSVIRMLKDEINLVYEAYLRQVHP